MIRKIGKWICIVFLITAGIGLAYLAVQPDPGPYLVAFRSDRPEQVSRALDAILTSDTVISYDGGAFPPASTEELEVLGLRYFHKATGQAREPLQGDTAAWLGFAHRVRVAIQSRPNR